MQELGLILALMGIGSGLVFFFKGVFEVATTPVEFKFTTFVRENANRIYLLVFGLVLSATALFLDPAGLADVFKALPGEVQVASPLLLGSALAGLVFVIPRNKPPEKGE